MQTVDVAVLGLGTMGSFACLELARRGLRVAGFDRFAPPHDRGSHSGDTRVFRVAYAEHPDYVPLAQRAGELWDTFGREFGTPLLTRCGMLSVGPASCDLISGIRRSAELHQLRIELLSREEIRRRFPVFAPPEEFVGIVEPTAGWVDVNAAIREALNAARDQGALIIPNTAPGGWKERGGRVVIETATESFEAGGLVIAAGAWSAALLRDLALPLTVQRKVLAWIDPIDPEPFAPGRFPVFAVADRFFYGFPNIGGHGVKLAIHWDDGQRLRDASDPIAEPGESDLLPILRMASEYLPGLAGAAPDSLSRVVRAKTCLYTMTPDEHFIIDRYPGARNVWFATGFSGHCFKFAPAIGAALADLATEGRTALPVDFLRIGQRFVSLA